MVEFFEGFAHHTELGMAIPLEDRSVRLPQHFGHDVIGHASRAEPCRERVAQLIERKVFDACALEGRRPTAFQGSEVRESCAAPGAREQID